MAEVPSPETRAGDIVVEQAGPAQLRATYPLIRLAAPEVDLRTWLRFAGPLVRGGRRGSGIVTARYGTQPHPCGLFCFRRDRCLLHGDVLTAEHLFAYDLLDPLPLLNALLGELEALAERLGCEAIRVLRSDRDGGHGAAWPRSARLLVFRSGRRGG